MLRIYKQITKSAVSHWPEVLNMTEREIKNYYAGLKGKTLTKNDLAFLLAIIKKVVLDKKHILLHDQQLWCAMALYNGEIAELYTGEGKTYAAAIAAILMRLKGHVHIVTVNEYLAERDANNTKEIYAVFGLTCSSNSRKSEKEKLYENDIVYSSSSEIIFDYLKLLLSGRRDKFHFENAIIDEIDFVLLDNANSRFSISVNNKEIPDATIYKKCYDFFKSLSGIEMLDDFGQEPSDKSIDYVYNTASRNVYLTDAGYSKLCGLFDYSDIINENISFYQIFHSTMEANLFYKNGKHYAVIDNKVKLICESNGRIQENSRLENTLHAAIEYKEGVPLTLGNGINYSLSYQVFFDKYRHLAGLSGTVYVANEEFRKIFGINVIKIPPNKEIKRIDHPDFLLKTKNEKINCICSYITQVRTFSAQPILIIAEDENIAEIIADKLTSTNIKVSLILNKNIAVEQKTIDQAGKKYAVTVSTNLLSRGTDIVLEQIFANTDGLLVICTSHYLSIRIDLQVKGRSGRQGQAGETIYITSLEDEIYKHFSKKSISKLQKIAANLPDYNNSVWLFCNLKERIKISKIIYEQQKYIQKMFAEVRYTNFLYDMTVEKYLDLIFMEQNDNLNNALDTSKTVLTKFQNIISERIHKDNIADLYRKQIEQFGKDASSQILCNLYFEVSYKLFVVYKDNMLKLTNYINNYNKSSYDKIYEYQYICGQQFKILRKDIWIEVLCYFLAAERKKQYNIKLASE